MIHERKEKKKKTASFGEDTLNYSLVHLYFIIEATI